MKKFVMLEVTGKAVVEGGHKSARNWALSHLKSPGVNEKKGITHISCEFCWQRLWCIQPTALQRAVQALLSAMKTLSKLSNTSVNFLLLYFVTRFRFQWNVGSLHSTINCYYSKLSMKYICNASSVYFIRQNCLYSQIKCQMYLI